jgi:hypothetical protein
MRWYSADSKNSRCSSFSLAAVLGLAHDDARAVAVGAERSSIRNCAGRRRAH